MKAFVLSIFDGEATRIKATILGYDREEALRLIGSEERGKNKNEITSPTKGVDEEVQRDCRDSMFSWIELVEMPLVRPSRLV